MTTRRGSMDFGLLEKLLHMNGLSSCLRRNLPNELRAGHHLVCTHLLAQEALQRQLALSDATWSFLHERLESIILHFLINTWIHGLEYFHIIQ